MREIQANWAAPANIMALTTTRLEGFSSHPFDSNNLALHVEDKEADVLKNRNRLRNLYDLTKEPAWLLQTHSNMCVTIDDSDNRQADAAITRTPNQALAVLTADCLPITICNKKGDEIAVIHAGWRGLAGGIICNTLKDMLSSSADLMAWIGPSICANCFETGEDVYFSFKKAYPFTQQAFTAHKEKWMGNLQHIAALILEKNGVPAIYQSNICTMENTDQYYSYRKMQQTGRIATLIWFK